MEIYLFNLRFCGCRASVVVSAGVFFVLFAYFVLVAFVYASCMLRDVLRFLNDISFLTYLKNLII